MKHRKHKNPPKSYTLSQAIGWFKVQTCGNYIEAKQLAQKWKDKK